MNKLFRLSGILSLPFLLTSCFSLDSIITIEETGMVRTENTIDISQMATMMQAFASGSTLSWSSSQSMNKNLCEDTEFTSWFSSSSGITVLWCTSLGDYKARVSTEFQAKKNPSILFLSGWIVVIDALYVSSNTSIWSPGSNDDNSNQFPEDMSPEELWIRMTESIIVPGKIAYKDGWILSSPERVNINLADPKIAKKKEFIIISTPSWKKLKPAEVAKYKRLLRNQVRLEKQKLNKTRNMD